MVKNIVFCSLHYKPKIDQKNFFKIDENVSLGLKNDKNVEKIHVQSCLGDMWIYMIYLEVEIYCRVNESKREHKICLTTLHPVVFRAEISISIT